MPIQVELVGEQTLKKSNTFGKKEADTKLSIQQLKVPNSNEKQKPKRGRTQ